MHAIAITGLGVTTALGQGNETVERALFAASNAFRIMQRPGRQRAESAFIGAEIESLQLPNSVSEKLRRTLSWSAQVAIATIAEAWNDAELDQIDPTRIGLVVGGSNLQQRELTVIQDSYRERFSFLRPTYGQMFMDTDIAAACSQQFGIRGVAHTVGGASASGHLAIVQAINAVQLGDVDACIALGSLTDLSYWECQGFRALGAMGSDRFCNDPVSACRPFDRLHDGFIFGESCGAIVIENAARSRKKSYACIRGWSYRVDGHRNPDPSLDGEIAAIKMAIQKSGIPATAIDYVNPHGTGSVIGDQIELQALKSCGLSHAHINATKSIVGHGLSAAGVVEVIATLLQMRVGKLHPTRNLEDPIDRSFNWVAAEVREHRIRNALNLSFGFGGINSAICLSNCVG